MVICTCFLFPWMRCCQAKHGALDLFQKVSWVPNWAMGDPAVLFGCEETCDFGKWAMHFFFTKKFPLDLFYSILQILHRNNIQKKTLEIAMLSTCDNFGKIRERNALRLNLIWNFTHRTRVRFVQFFGKLFGVKIQPWFLGLFSEKATIIRFW